MLSKGKKIALLVIYVCGFLVLPLLFALIGMHLLGLEGVYLLSIINFLSYFVLCGILLFLSRHVYKEDFKKIESWWKFMGQIAFGLLLTFGSVFIGNLIVMQLGDFQIAENQEAIVNTLNAMPLLMMITAIVFGPIVEEIIFRLVLMNLFNWKPVCHLLFSSLIFGLFHVLIGGWLHIITYTLAGLVFGYFYLKHDKNIWHVTVLHIFHNGVTIGLVFWAQYLFEAYYG